MLSSVRIPNYLTIPEYTYTCIYNVQTRLYYHISRISLSEIFKKVIWCNLQGTHIVLTVTIRAFYTEPRALVWKIPQRMGHMVWNTVLYAVVPNQIRDFWTLVLIFKQFWAALNFVQIFDNHSFWIPVLNFGSIETVEPI